MKQRHKIIAKILAVSVLILFCVFVSVFLGKPLLTMVEDPEAFRQMVEEDGIRARLLFVGLVVVQVIVALIPGEPLEICAGIAFGGLEGTLLCLLGIFLGSTVVFFLVRRLGVKLVESFFSMEKIRSLRFLQNERRLNIVLFLLMVIPGTPKDLLSYFVPLTPIRAGHWLALTTIARIPSVVTSTVGGDALGEGEYLLAVIVFAVTCAVGICGALFFDYYTRKRKKKEKGE
ncbi:MAG: TVP38/TMEM64 family protein [Ruminococcaceae bacterium]|nr:TVP38/TMEM64 family protein [Oscillospiraceae bacterium]